MRRWRALFGPSNDNRPLRFAHALAARTTDAYSFNRYANWPACAAALERAGFTERQAEAILRSRITRWAADESQHKYGSATAADLMAFIARQPRAVRIEGRA